MGASLDRGGIKARLGVCDQLNAFLGAYLLGAAIQD